MTGPARNQPGRVETKACGCIFQINPDGSERITSRHYTCQLHVAIETQRLQRDGGDVALLREDEKRLMWAENKKCEDLAQREGDRLLKAGDEKGGIACLKLAAIMRTRRDQILSPF